VQPGALFAQGGSSTQKTVKRFVSGGCDNMVKIWKEEDGQWVEEHKLEGHSDWVRDVAWAPSVGLSRTFIASASQDRRVIIWSSDGTSNNWTPLTLNEFSDIVWHVSWSITGNILAVSCGDNRVRYAYNYCNSILTTTLIWYL
jgi:protein transport protein SEC13